jgi:hypothetical protein
VERFFYLNVWNGIVIFGSLAYLSAGLGKAAIIAIFVVVSGLLRFGQTWLIRGGFAIGLVAIAVALGFPQPVVWPKIIREAGIMMRIPLPASVDGSANSDSRP